MKGNFLLFVFIIHCVWLNNVSCLVKRDVTSTTSSPGSDHLGQMQNHIKEFQHCIDMKLAKIVDQVQRDQVKPVLEVINHELEKFVKVWDILKEPISTSTTAKAEND